MAHLLYYPIETKYNIKVECVDDFEPLVEYCRSRPLENHLFGYSEIPEELVPRRYVVKARKIPTFGFFAAPGGYIVDDRFPEFIEKVEPGVHRFFELDIKMADGRPLERPHFLLNCRTKVDAVIAEKSKGRIKGVLDRSVGVQVITLEDRACALDWCFSPLGTHDDLFLKKDVIAGRALWWDHRLYRLYISDAFHDHLMASGVEGLADDGRVQEV